MGDMSVLGSQQRACEDVDGRGLSASNMVCFEFFKFFVCAARSRRLLGAD